METTTQTGLRHPELRRVRDGYWRVTAASGLVLGYVEQLEAEQSGAPRYRARRLHAAASFATAARISDIGEFASREEAAECLR
ncbi:hypothetical protein VD659_15845 [Herbiconiux sp. 11R-BC]|uniref:hypothetical protein n=1 Tax=Herbiconiux sp. 11R-BC TaxID=3111637 RepID=UPI003C0F1113